MARGFSPTAIRYAMFISSITRRGGVKRQWRGHRGGVTHVAAQPSTRFVLSCGEGGDLKLWDPEHDTQASIA